MNNEEKINAATAESGETADSGEKNDDKELTRYEKIRNISNL